ncbi:MAG: biotin transporter BioY [Lachnospiraceae bacterium]|nr:biotin transporter BioY [Lachnospiraceae bacterium]
MENKRESISNLTLIGLMAAVTCVLGPLSIPIGPVPITFTNLAIYLTVILLGWKKGTISYIIYLLIGLVGIPVFSGFTGGPGKLFGPTGGYLIGFAFMALISGIFVDKFKGKIGFYVVGMVLGIAVTYLFGTAWLAYQASMSFTAALGAGVIPFIPGDLVKIVIAVIIGPIIRKRIVKAGYLN